MPPDRTTQARGAAGGRDSGPLQLRASLRERARQRRRERDIAADDDLRQRLAREAATVVRWANQALELDGDERLTGDDLRPLTARWERNLFAFELDGLDFIVGTFWHGNPGDDDYLAVRVGKASGDPEWPPPHPRSVSNTRWAPAGYKAVYSLAMLGDALEADGAS